MSRLSIPYLQIRSNTLYQYNQSENTGRFTRLMQSELAKNIAWLKDEEGNIIKRPTYSGILSPGAKKRLTKAIEYMVMASPHKTIINPTNGKKQGFKLSFITLTVHSPERNIQGKEAHKNLLEPFLQWMRRKFGCCLYLWKAELQKRGQLHYHITSDVFIPYDELERKWNSLQAKHGYLETYLKKHGHVNAPSTEIRSVRKIKNIGGYLIKEIAKSFQNTESIGGKVWDCSMNLKSCKYYTTLADSGYSDRINKMVREKEIIQVKSGSDHCRIFRMIEKPGHSILNETDRLEYNLIMHSIRSKETELIKPERKSARKKTARPLLIDLKTLTIKQQGMCNIIHYTKLVRRPGEGNNINFNLKNHGRIIKVTKAEVNEIEECKNGGFIPSGIEQSERLELRHYCRKNSFVLQRFKWAAWIYVSRGKCSSINQKKHIKWQSSSQLLLSSSQQDM